MDENFLATAECIIIIPENSCGICVEGSISFLKKQIDVHKGLYAVVNSYSNPKDLKLKFGKSLFEGPRVILDKDENISKAGLEITSPTVIFIDKGSIKDMISIKPSIMEQTFETVLSHINRSQ